MVDFIYVIVFKDINLGLWNRIYTNAGNGQE